MKNIISIDLGGTNLKIGLLDQNCNIRYKAVLSTNSFTRKDDLITAIIDSIQKIIKDKNLKKSGIQGIGLGLPGPIDVQRGIVHFFPNIPGWKEVKLKDILQKRLRLPVHLDNDANLMALAEFYRGAALKAKNAVCLTLGTGVGGGIIIEGRLYRGSTFNAGEIGHIPINEEGPQCNCAGKACLEAYVGNTRILKRARQIFRRNITLEEVSILAKRKNKRAIKIWQDVGRRLGIALSGVVNLLNPDVIVIGGGLAGAGEVLFRNIRLTIKQRAMRVQAKHVKVLAAKLGSDAGLIGAALLVRENLRWSYK
jgi:glucokinase